MDRVASEVLRRLRLSSDSWTPSRERIARPRGNAGEHQTARAPEEEAPADRSDDGLIVLPPPTNPMAVARKLIERHVQAQHPHPAPLARRLVDVDGLALGRARGTRGQVRGLRVHRAGVFLDGRERARTVGADPVQDRQPARGVGGDRPPRRDDRPAVLDRRRRPARRGDGERPAPARWPGSCCRTRRLYFNQTAVPFDYDADARPADRLAGVPRRAVARRPRIDRGAAGVLRLRRLRPARPPQDPADRRPDARRQGHDRPHPRASSIGPANVAGPTLSCCRTTSGWRR